MARNSTNTPRRHREFNSASKHAYHFISRKWSFELLLRLCGRVFPGGAVREVRLWYRNECVWHARGRARVAAVQELVYAVDISCGAVREEKSGGPSRPGRQRLRACARRSGAKPVHEMQSEYDAIRRYEALRMRSVWRDRIPDR